MPWTADARSPAGYTRTAARTWRGPRRSTYGRPPIRRTRCRHITVPVRRGAGHDELDCGTSRGRRHVKRVLSVRDTATRNSLRKAFDDLGYEVIPFKKTEQSVLSCVPKDVRLTVTASPDRKSVV